MQVCPNTHYYAQVIIGCAISNLYYTTPKLALWYVHKFTGIATLASYHAVDHLCEIGNQ